MLVVVRVKYTNNKNGMCVCVCVCVCVCRPPLFSLSAIARVCFVRVCNNETRGRTERIQVGKKKKKVLVLAKKVLGAKKLKP